MECNYIVDGKHSHSYRIVVLAKHERGYSCGIHVGHVCFSSICQHYIPCDLLFVSSSGRTFHCMVRIHWSSVDFYHIYIGNGGIVHSVPICTSVFPRAFRNAFSINRFVYRSTYIVCGILGPNKTYSTYYGELKKRGQRGIYFPFAGTFLTFFFLAIAFLIFLIFLCNFSICSSTR